jgi:signal transduction histidine kinase/glycosyltransferase involved in cell wall biosynthesis
MATQPLRVLHVIWTIEPSKGSGPADALRALALEQSKLGLEVTILTADSAESIDAVVPPLKESGIRVIAAGPMRPFQTTHAARAAIRKAIADGVDVMHIHCLWQALPHCAAAEASRAGVPYILRTAGMLEPWALKKGWLKKKLHMALVSRRHLSQARALQATSYVEARHLAGLGLGSPIAVVAHGVELEARDTVRRDADVEARWPQLKGVRRLLFLGRIDPVKGTMPLAEAWGRVARDFPDWRLVIAGPDWAGHRAELEESLSIRGVRDKTIFVGTVRGSDKRLLLAGCDLFVQPSFQENFGITIAEALACGLPVITTKGTPWQVLSVRGAGWWIDIGADPLERALREAMPLDSQTLREMGRKGPWIVEERSSWPRIAARLTTVYDWMLDRAKQPDFVYRSEAEMPEGWGVGRTAHPATGHRAPPGFPRIPVLSQALSDFVVRYGTMLGIVLLSVAARWAIDPWVKDRLSLFLAYTAVAVCTFLLGVRAGLAALVLGYLLNSFLFMEPRGTLMFSGTVDTFKVLLYAGSGLATCLVASWVTRREEQARERERHAEETIAEQAAELARSNAELEEFAQMVARDLKEPLRAIATNTRRLLDVHGKGLTEHGRVVAALTDRQARRGMTMVDSLLELSRAGKDLKLQEVDLNSVLEDVLEDLSALVAEHRAEVVRGRLPVVRCDRAQVARVLSILIKNGLLYNVSDAKRVEVGAGPGRIGTPAVFVRDNGIGIAPEDREQVFELFSRARGNGKPGGGMGMGLAVVKRLVEGHGGVVWVESRPGVGSTFSFTLERTELGD